MVSRDGINVGWGRSWTHNLRGAFFFYIYIFEGCLVRSIIFPLILMSVQHLPELPVESTKNMLISGLTWQGQRELSVGCLTIQSWQKRTKSCLLASIVFHESPGTTLTFFRVPQVHTKSRPSGRASLHSLWCSQMSMRIHRVIYSLSLNSVESIAFDHPGPSSSHPPFCANIPII